jgi:rfaE bifunctional protein kinase chain/domain
MSAELSALARDLAGARVLVWGDLMLDAYLVGSVRRISPEAPVPVVEVSDAYDRIGGAANAAANCAALGASTALVGLVGDDDPAHRLRALVTECGIEAVLLAGTGPTTVKQRLIAVNQQVARIDFEARLDYTPEQRDEVVAALRPQVDAAGAVLVSDYGKGACTPEIIACLVEMAAASGTPVVVDPKGADFTRYRGATLLTPNEREAREGSRSVAEDLDEVVGVLMGELPGSALAVTRAEHGVRLFRPDAEPVTLPARARAVADVTGAGDTVAAVLAASMAVGAGLEDAVALANVAAGVTVERVGTHAVGSEELVERVSAGDG